MFTFLSMIHKNLGLPQITTNHIYVSHLYIIWLTLYWVDDFVALQTQLKMGHLYNILYIDYLL